MASTLASGSSIPKRSVVSAFEGLFQCEKFKPRRCHCHQSGMYESVLTLRRSYPCAPVGPRRLAETALGWRVRVLRARGGGRERRLQFLGSPCGSGPRGTRVDAGAGRGRRGLAVRCFAGGGGRGAGPAHGTAAHRPQRGAARAAPARCRPWPWSRRRRCGWSRRRSRARCGWPLRRWSGSIGRSTARRWRRRPSWCRRGRCSTPRSGAGGARAALSGSSLALRWRAGEAAIVGRPRRRRAGARQPDRSTRSSTAGPR